MKPIRYIVLFQHYDVHSYSQDAMHQAFGQHIVAVTSEQMEFDSAAERDDAFATITASLKGTQVQAQFVEVFDIERRDERSNYRYR